MNINHPNSVDLDFDSRSCQCLQFECHFLEPPLVFVQAVSVLPEFLHQSRSRSPFVGPASLFGLDSRSHSQFVELASLFPDPVVFVQPVSLPPFSIYAVSIVRTVLLERLHLLFFSQNVCITGEEILSFRLTHTISNYNLLLFSLCQGRGAFFWFFGIGGGLLIGFKPILFTLISA
jgi:hypothetical protein